MSCTDMRFRSLFNYIYRPYVRRVERVEPCCSNMADDEQLSYTGWSKKRIPSFYFWDNFGNSAPIFKPFFHCYKQKFMARKREVLPSTAPLLCDHITYSKTNTILLISPFLITASRRRRHSKTLTAIH